MASIDDIVLESDIDYTNVPDPSGHNVTIGQTKEEALARRNAPKATPRTSTPKRKRIATVNKNAKTMKKDQPKRTPYKDTQAYILIRGKGKGTYATVKGTEELYTIAKHGYVSRIYKVDSQGNPMGKNMVDGKRVFKNGKMTFTCPEH